MIVDKRPKKDTPTKHREGDRPGGLLTSLRTFCPVECHGGKVGSIVQMRKWW